MSDLALARRGIAVVFLVFGILNGTWVSRIPSVQQHLDLSTGALSLALLSAPVGQVVAAQFVSPLVRRWTSAAVARVAVIAAAASLVAPGLAVGTASLAAALLLFGLSLGTYDIVMNAQAVAVERGYGRPLVSGLHGMYSVGAFAGAGGGAVAVSAGASPVVHFAAVGGAMAGCATWGATKMLDESADAVIPAPVGGGPVRAERLLHHPLLLAIGAIAFCAFFAEGAVDNWSGVYLHGPLGGSLAVAPYGAAACGAAMAVGRFCGDRVIAAVGRQRTLMICAALTATGAAATVAAPNVGTAVAGYAVLGLGLSTIAPIVFTVAGTLPSVAPAWAISRITSLGFAGLFGAPPVVGLLAGATDLRTALAVPAALGLLVLPLGVIAGRLRRAAQ